MAPLNVTIKHAGKTYPIQLDTSEPPIVFKNAIYQATGVPVDRMKVMTKAGVLKVQRLELWRYRSQVLTSCVKGRYRLEEGGAKRGARARWRNGVVSMALTQSPNQGGSFMVVGSAGELPKAPEKPIVFLEGENLG